MTPGARLRTAREALHLSLSEAAAAAGMKKQNWHAIEAGKSATLDKLHWMATAIGTDPSAIDVRLAPVVARPRKR